VKYRLVVRPEVDDDLLAAETWYDQPAGRVWVRKVPSSGARGNRKPRRKPTAIQSAPSRASSTLGLSSGLSVSHRVSRAERHHRHLRRRPFRAANARLAQSSKGMMIMLELDK
jgi:hypothetical protein